MKLRILPSKLGGYGLFAGRAYVGGDTIFDEAFLPVRLLGIVNHSCEPNCRLENYRLISLHPIRKYEELTFDYADVKIPVLPLEFDCICGSPKCKGRITVCGV
jgi:SET domain-containing protein